MTGLWIPKLRKPRGAFTAPTIRVANLIATLVLTILVTGIAGFIGYHIAKSLLEKGEKVIGIDNISSYYDVNLKKDRLKHLEKFNNLKFYNIDISNLDSLDKVFDNNSINKICHLAAQAGVRYSLKAPLEYISSNIVGHVNILECCAASCYFKRRTPYSSDLHHIVAPTSIDKKSFSIDTVTVSGIDPALLDGFRGLFFVIPVTS